MMLMISIITPPIEAFVMQPKHTTTIMSSISTARKMVRIKHSMVVILLRHFVFQLSLQQNLLSNRGLGQ